MTETELMNCLSNWYGSSDQQGYVVKNSVDIEYTIASDPQSQLFNFILRFIATFCFWYISITSVSCDSYNPSILSFDSFYLLSY